MIKLLVRKPISRESFEAIAHAEGFARIVDLAFTAGSRTTNWSRGENIIGFVADSMTGAALFLARGPQEATVASAIGTFVELETQAEAIFRATAATTPAERVASILRLGLLLRDEALPAEVISLWKTRLLDEEKPVRWAAYYAALGLLREELDDVMAKSARRYPDMAAAARRFRRGRLRADEQQQKSEQEETRRDLFASLPKLCEQASFQKLEEATRAALADSPALASSYFYRALALSGLGRDAEALPFLYAAVCLGREDEKEEFGGPRATMTQTRGDSTQAQKEAVVATLLFLHERLMEAEKEDIFVDVLRFVSADMPELSKEVSFALATLLDEEGEPDSAEALERALAFFPERAEPLFMLAESRSRSGDFEGAIPAYDSAIALLEGQQDSSPEAIAASRLYELVRLKLTLWDVDAKLMDRALEHESYAVLLAAAERAIKHDEDNVSAFQNRGLALTFLGRHDEAIAAYTEALGLMESVVHVGHGKAEDPRGLMFFNRAREFAKLGKRERAFADLAEAVHIDGIWGKRARNDEYFQTHFGDRDFGRITAGFADVSPNVQATRSLISRCLEYFYQGRSEQALEAGEDAEMAAEVLADPALLSDARKAYGNALTFLKSPAEGIPKLESALALAAIAFPDEPGRRGEIMQLLGSAYHEARAWEQADRCYREALLLQKAAEGETSWKLAKSYGDLARLGSARGLSASDVALTLEQGRHVLRIFLLTNPLLDERSEALLDLATLSLNLCVTWSDAGDQNRALSALEDSTESLGAMLAAGRRPRQGLTKRALEQAFLLSESADMAQRDHASRLITRLFEILEPSPRVREERLYCAKLRGAALDLIRKSISPSAIASAMHDALLGHELPEPFRSSPMFKSLALSLATRLGGRDDVVAVAKALSSAMKSGSLDAAFEKLEALAIAEAERCEGVVEDF